VIFENPLMQNHHSSQNEVDITIVVTCYNEGDLIQKTLDNVSSALMEAGASFEIIVVDDASKDNSTEQIRSFIQKYPERNIVLKANSKNRGLANNYIDTAFVGKGRFYRLCCGDDPEPREVLVNIFRHIGKADVVIPFQEQSHVAGKSSFRKLLSKTFTHLVNLISGYKIEYYNGLAIHLRYNVMRYHPSSYGFGFQADMITRLLDEGVTFMQIPSTSIDRKGGASTALNTRNILSVGHTLLELAIRRIRRAMYGKNMPKPREVFPS
jgi:glycosyltransferase involved in cell wall biosynthesis